MPFSSLPLPNAHFLALTTQLDPNPPAHIPFFLKYDEWIFVKQMLMKWNRSTTFWYMTRVDSGLMWDWFMIRAQDQQEWVRSIKRFSCRGPFWSSEEVNNIKLCILSISPEERKFKLKDILNSRYFTRTVGAASYASYWIDFHIFYLIQ